MTEYRNDTTRLGGTQDESSGRLLLLDAVFLPSRRRDEGGGVDKEGGGGEAEADGPPTRGAAGADIAWPGAPAAGGENETRPVVPPETPEGPSAGRRPGPGTVSVGSADGPGDVETGSPRTSASLSDGGARPGAPSWCSLAVDVGSAVPQASWLADAG